MTSPHRRPGSARAAAGCAASRRELLLLGAAAALAGCTRDRRSGITIGSSPTGVPFSFIDPWTNRFTGAMIDTAGQVCTAIGVGHSFEIVPFAALIPSLTTRKIDMIAAALLRTPAREEVVAFSRPVGGYSGGLVVRAEDRRAYPDLASARALRVGAQVGSRFVEQLAAAGVARTIVYDSLSDILRDLDHGRIDAGYGDEPILRYQLKVGPRRDARLPAEFRAPAREELCLVLRKGDPLLARVDRAIAVLSATAIPAIEHRWGLG